MKRLFLVGLIPIICLSLAGVPALAESNDGQSPNSSQYASPMVVGRYGQPVPPPGAVIFDTLILRPLGLAAMGVGFGMAVVALPFAALSNNTDSVVQSLIVEPSNYTFQRPLGYIYPAYAPPPTVYAARPTVLGKWVRVPGQWVNGKWVPPHMVWVPVNP
jgi:hypothetical protein